MKLNPWRRAFGAGLVIAAIIRPAALWACAACYGQSDAPMAQGMNWGILSLLGIVMTVLGGVTAFFMHLARRSAAMADASAGAATGAQGCSSPRTRRQHCAELELCAPVAASAQPSAE